MKISARQIDRFLERPDPSVRAVLVYGPDEGLVRERGERLAHAIVEDLSDPFRVVELTPSALAEVPSRLADEAAAIAFGGGRRLVRVRGAGEIPAAGLETVLRHGIGDAFIIVEAGDLAPRSALRRLTEGAKEAAALPCYRDSTDALERLITATLREVGLGVEPDAVAYLLANLGGDRQVSRRELEKLSSYMGAGSRREVSLADAMASIGDVSAMTLEDLAFSVAAGDHGALERRLRRSLDEGTSPVQVLRAATRHLTRLHLASAARDQGSGIEQAIRDLRPPVFFKRTESFKAQLRAWSTGRLGTALQILLNAEIDCKTTGLPAHAVYGRALMRIAQAARSSDA